MLTRSEFTLPLRSWQQVIRLTIDGDFAARDENCRPGVVKFASALSRVSEPFMLESHQPIGTDSTAYDDIFLGIIGNLSTILSHPALLFIEKVASKNQALVHQMMTAGQWDKTKIKLSMKEGYKLVREKSVIKPFGKALKRLKQQGECLTQRNYTFHNLMRVIPTLKNFLTFCTYLQNENAFVDETQVPVILGLLRKALQPFLTSAAISVYFGKIEDEINRQVALALAQLKQGIAEKNREIYDRGVDGYQNIFAVYDCIGDCFVQWNPHHRIQDIKDGLDAELKRYEFVIDKKIKQTVPVAEVCPQGKAVKPVKKRSKRRRRPKPSAEVELVSTPSDPTLYRQEVGEIYSEMTKLLQLDEGCDLSAAIDKLTGVTARRFAVEILQTHYDLLKQFETAMAIINQTQKVTLDEDTANLLVQLHQRLNTKATTLSAYLQLSDTHLHYHFLVDLYCDIDMVILFDKLRCQFLQLNNDHASAMIDFLHLGLATLMNKMISLSGAMQYAQKEQPQMGRKLATYKVSSYYNHAIIDDTSPDTQQLLVTGDDRKQLISST